jgi:ribosomal protein S18 acetylase RimI-like enzyme
MDDDELTLRPAEPQDYAFCELTYFEPLRVMIDDLGLQEVRRRTRFAERWQIEQVRMALLRGQVIGWLQTVLTGDAVFVEQLFIDAAFRGLGIGGRIMKTIIDEAAQQGKVVTLGVVKTNPARRLYERLGFQITHEDERKYYMRYEVN